MRFARSGGSPEHDVQPLLQIAPGVEACDHAPVEPALLYEVDGPQVRLRVARSGPFDQALDPDAHVDGVGVVDGEPDHLSVAQWCACPFVEALRGIPFRKLQDRQCGLHRLIVKPFHGEQSADHGGAVGADAFRPLLAVFPVPRLPRGFAGRSASFVEYLLETVAGRSRCEHNRVFSCQISNVLAPIRRSTVEPTYYA